MKTVAFWYHLQIRFSEPVTHHRFTVRSFPVSDGRQEILSVSQELLPNQFLENGTDSFGNLCVYGNAEEPHELFDVQVQGTARLGMQPWTAAREAHQVGVFRTQTPLTQTGPSLLRLSSTLDLAACRGNREKAEAIMHAVAAAMRYLPGRTTFETTAEEALSGGAGVCQDYAHIMLALCRLAGVPCRYVVGLLIGEGASHAWVEIYDDCRWFGMDPTNLVPVTDSHVKLSHGRDYNDCLLNRGIFCGAARQEQSVRVKVEEIMEPSVLEESGL